MPTAIPIRETANEGRAERALTRLYLDAEPHLYELHRRLWLMSLAATGPAHHPEAQPEEHAEALLELIGDAQRLLGEIRQAHANAAALRGAA